MKKHKTYELAGSEYIEDQGGYLDNNLKLVCYSTKGGKERKSARNGWQSENPHRMYWEDVPQKLYATEERVRGSYGASDPAWLKRHLIWQGCGRAVAFGRTDDHVNSEHVGRYRGYATFIRCSNKADGTGFCKVHIASAIKDGKVKHTTRFFLSMKKMFNQILRR